MIKKKSHDARKLLPNTSNQQKCKNSFTAVDNAKLESFGSNSNQHDNECQWHFN